MVDALKENALKSACIANNRLARRAFSKSYTGRLHIPRFPSRGDRASKRASTMSSVGVLALQGSFNEHIAALRRIGVIGVEVRKAEQLENLSGLIIPGGESTTMAKLAQYHNLLPALRDFVKTGRPVWGTCAGLIFLADRAVGQKSGGQELVGGLDCTVHRNFFGSQLQSFETEILVPDLAAKEGGPTSFRGVFIRAPAILEIGSNVEVLADYSVVLNKSVSPRSPFDSQEEKMVAEEKVIVAVKQRNLLGTAFHPELTADTRWHSFFMRMVSEGGGTSSSQAPISEGNAIGDDESVPYDLPIFQ